MDTSVSFVCLLLVDLKAGKHIFLYCSSHTYLTETILPHQLYELHGLRYREYHRSSKQHQVLAEDVNQSWSDVQLVATTSTITVGCNFDVPNVFHMVYIYASAVCHNLVRDIFQASYRVRHLIDEHMVYHVDPRHFGQNLPTEEGHIRASLDVKERLMVDSVSTLPWISALRARNVQELNVSVMFLEHLFQRYLRECNYVEGLDAADMLLHLDLHTSKPAQYCYNDIPQLIPTMCTR